MIPFFYFKKFIWLNDPSLFVRQAMSALLVISCVLTLLPSPVQAENEPQATSLYSGACALMDGDSGRLLYEKEAAKPMANASTTKIMTCILALENSSSEEVVTASAKAAAQPKVHLGMREGEQFYLRDLLYALMLESYNDCAVAIAEHIAGSTEGFAVLMNEKASALGCTDTYFITPNGLDGRDEKGFHHTTAADLCRIMKYCAWESEKSEEFLSITQKTSHSFTDLSRKNTYGLANHNSFMSMMDGVISGKTGFTAEAGYCYVAALESGGRKFCIALLACGWPNNKTYKWKDAAKLFQYGINEFSYQQISKPTELPLLTVTGGCHTKSLGEWGKKQTLRPVCDTRFLPERILLGSGEKVTWEVSCPKSLTAPVPGHETIGSVTYSLDGDVICALPIYLEEGLEKWTFQDLCIAVARQFFLVGESSKF